MEKTGKTFLLRLTAFLLPFATALLIEVTFFPLDAFTFRVWEGVAVSDNPWINQFVPGMPFYPDKRIEKTETGDLGHHTRFARPKNVLWQTDPWGFRNSVRAGGSHDVVVVGDSFAAGSALTQGDTIAAALERQTGLRTYAYAPGLLEAFLKEERFRVEPRPVVVFQFFERELFFSIPRQDDVRPIKSDFVHRDDHRPGPLVQMWTSAVVALDRYCKGTLLRSARARVREAFVAGIYDAVGAEFGGRPALGAIVGSDDQTLFLLVPAANLPFPRVYVDRSVARLVEFDRAIRESGFRSILLAAPNKENIHYDLLVEPRRPAFLDQVVAGVRGAGIEVVDLQPAYRAAKENGLQVYHFDDTHWTAEGVRIAADALSKVLPNQPNRISQADTKGNARHSHGR